MTNDPRRITLLCRGRSTSQRDWNLDGDANTRVIVMHTFSVLSFALHNGVSELQQDVERVVIDRATTAAGFLDLLASLPHGFTGDILFIRDDDSAYLSATGRGGDRVLYALRGPDVDFYLSAHGLTMHSTVEPWQTTALPQLVLQTA